MSVCNFFLAADRLMILTDSVQYAGKEPAALGSKIHLNEPAGLAVTVLGLTLIGETYARLLQGWGNREQAELGIEALIEACPPSVMVRKDGSLRGYTVTLFGWESRAPFVKRWNHHPDGTVSRYTFEPGLYLTPSFGKQQQPADVTPEQMRQVAELQQRLATRNGLTMCIGGWMDVTTIDADGVRTERLADYPDLATTERRIARRSRVDQERQEVAA